MRLFCFPFAGGSAQAFREWRDHLPQSIELCAVQLPGREMRQRETPIASADDIVEALLPALLPLMDRPFILFGHSMGAVIAFELARGLQQEGRPTPECLIVSGRVAPHRPLTRAPINHLILRLTPYSNNHRHKSQKISLSHSLKFSKGIAYLVP
jgi:medium-chain acyl-[acyl-carrier-protein] hydrolase